MEIETPENVLSTETYTQAVGILNSNMVSSTLSVSVNANAAIKSLNIYNTNGQLIKSVDLTNQAENPININVENLSQGIYYLSAQNLNAPLKFVKI